MYNIILDLEWNNVYSVYNNCTRRCPNEIIEIGAVKTDENFNSISAFEVLVIPKIYNTIGDETYEITKISYEELLKYGCPFKIALFKFMKWCGNECRFFTWGANDIIELQRNINFHYKDFNMDYFKYYIDIQLEFMNTYNITLTPSLENAISLLNIKYSKSKAHRAYADSIYAYNIIKKISNKNESFVVSEVLLNKLRENQKNYDVIEKDEDFTIYSYDDYKDIVLKHSHTRCPQCGRFINIVRTYTKKRHPLEMDKKIIPIVKKYGICKKCNIFIRRIVKIVKRDDGFRCYAYDTIIDNQTWLELTKSW